MKRWISVVVLMFFIEPRAAFAQALGGDNALARLPRFIPTPTQPFSIGHEPLLAEPVQQTLPDIASAAKVKEIFPNTEVAAIELAGRLDVDGVKQWWLRHADVLEVVHNMGESEIMPLLMGQERVYICAWHAVKQKTLGDCTSLQGMFVGQSLEHLVASDNTSEE